MHSSQYVALAQELDEFGTVCVAMVTFPTHDGMNLQGWLIDAESDPGDDCDTVYGVHLFNIGVTDPTGEVRKFNVSFQASTNGLTRERAYELFSQNVKHAQVFDTDKHYRRPEPYDNMCACGEAFTDEHLADVASKATD